MDMAPETDFVKNASYPPSAKAKPKMPRRPPAPPTAASMGQKKNGKMGDLAALFRKAAAGTSIGKALMPGSK